MATKVVPYVTLSIGVVSGMFFFTYLPQLAVLVFVNGPLAVFTTVMLVLNESSTIINIISRNWLLQDAILDTFDGTLVARNDTGIVREGREIKSGSDPMARLGKIIKSPFERYSPKAIIRYFMYLPLNFIPIVGTVLFIILQGRTRGRIVHDRVSLANCLLRGTWTNNIAVLSTQKVVGFREVGLDLQACWSLHSVRHSLCP